MAIIHKFFRLIKSQKLRSVVDRTAKLEIMALVVARSPKLPLLISERDSSVPKITVRRSLPSSPGPLGIPSGRARSHLEIFPIPHLLHVLRVQRGHTGGARAILRARVVLGKRFFLRSLIFVLVKFDEHCRHFRLVGGGN